MLIVGAGIGGLTFIRAMRNTNWSIDVIEKFTAFPKTGIGIVLHPNGLHVLAQMGMADYILSAGEVIRRMRLVRGKTEACISLPEVWSNMKYSTISILRPLLHDILYKYSIEMVPNQVKLHLARTLSSVNLTSHQPQVKFNDGSSTTYDLIVGSDGVNSFLRRSLLGANSSVCTDLFYFRFLAPNIIDIPDNTWITREVNDLSYGFIPVSKSYAHCFVQFRTKQAPCKTGSEAGFLESVLKSLNPAMLKMFEARSGHIHSGFAYMVRPIYWGNDRCVLLGDAAHAISPTLSEGGSLAMEDALVLATSLYKFKNNIPKALEGYRRARNDRVLWAYRMSLGQINAARRGRDSRPLINSETATSYMRQMYEPFHTSPLPPELLSD